MIETIDIEQQTKSYWALLGHEGLGYTEIRGINKTDNYIESYFISLYDEFKKTLSYFKSSTVDIFVGINPRKVRSGKAEDVSYLCNLVLDIDELKSPKEFFMWEHQTLIDSGRGVHLYYPIEPIKVENNLKELTQQLKHWTDFERGDLKIHGKVDHVFDLSRVMRCPGTINTKNSSICRFLAFNPDFKRIPSKFYLQDIVPPLSNPLAMDTSVSIALARFKNLIEIDPVLARIIKAEFGSASEKVFILVKSLINYGFTKAEINQIIEFLDIKTKENKSYEKDIERIILKSENANNLKSLNLHWSSYENQLDKRELGFFTGYPSLDEKTGGFHRKELVVIGARSSIGKTTFVMNLIAEFLKKDLRVLIFPTEMSFVSMIDKLVSMECEIPLWRFRKNQLLKEDKELISKKRKEFEDYKLFISEIPSPKLKLIEDLYKNLNYDVMVLDYVQRVDTSMPNKRSMDLELFIRGVKNLAKENNFCAILTSQLNRLAEESSPDIKTLRDTDVLQHEGDLVLLLGTKDKFQEPRDLSLLVAKNRFGELGYIPMKFYTSCGIIKEII